MIPPILRSPRHLVTPSPLLHHSVFRYPSLGPRRRHHVICRILGVERIPGHAWIFHAGLRFPGDVRCDPGDGGQHRLGQAAAKIYDSQTSAVGAGYRAPGFGLTVRTRLTVFLEVARAGGTVALFHRWIVVCRLVRFADPLVFRCSYVVFVGLRGHWGRTQFRQATATLGVQPEASENRLDRRLVDVRHGRHRVGFLLDGVCRDRLN